MGEAERIFNEAWLHLARSGSVDDLHGAEYKRVYGEWQKAEQPGDVLEFIKEHVSTKEYEPDVNTGDSGH